MSSISTTTTSTIRRLGVLGDVHGEHVRLEAALEWLAGQRVDAVICTGDVADGAGCLDRSCTLLRQAEVLTVAGNHDRWLLTDRVRHLADAHRLEHVAPETADYLRGLPQIRELDTVGGPLLLCHGMGERDMAKVWPGTRGPESIRRCRELDGLLESGRYRFIIHGHLHYRVLIDFESALLVNAGTLKGPRAGVSIVDFEADVIAAFDLEDGRPPQPSVEHALTPGPERRVWRSTADFDGAWNPVLL